MNWQVVQTFIPGYDDSTPPVVGQAIGVCYGIKFKPFDLFVKFVSKHKSDAEWVCNYLEARKAVYDLGIDVVLGEAMVALNDALDLERMFLVVDMNQMNQMNLMEENG